VVVATLVLVAAISLAPEATRSRIHIVIVVVTALVGSFLLWIPTSRQSHRLTQSWWRCLQSCPVVPFVIGLTGNYVVLILLFDPVACGY